MPALAREPVGALGVDAGNPVNGLDVVNECGLVKQSLLGYERRAMAWLAGFAFQGLDQGRFLAANVRARAPA